VLRTGRDLGRRKFSRCHSSRGQERLRELTGKVITKAQITSTSPEECRPAAEESASSLLKKRGGGVSDFPKWSCEVKVPIVELTVRQLERRVLLERALSPVYRGYTVF
jgi:hypothetical protein